MAVTKKKTELDILNVFLCFLVLFIHTASEPVTKLSADAVAFAPLFMLWKAATVAVPGFLFVSGIKLGLGFSSSRKSYGAFLRDKLLKIYVPYVLYVCVYYVYFITKDYFSFRFWDLLSYIFIGDLAAHFYFVVILMQFFILMPIFKGWIEKYSPLLLLTASLLVTVLFGQFWPDMLRAVSGGKIEFLYNDRLFTSYLFYYMLGMLAGHKYNAYLAFLKENKKPIVILGLFVLLLNIGFSYAERKNGVYFGFSYLLQTVYCVGILPLLSVVAVSLAKHKKPFESKTFRMINASTFSVYLLHLLVMFSVNDLLEFLPSLGILELFVLRFTATTLITFGLCMLYAWLKQKFFKK